MRVWSSFIDLKSDLSGQPLVVTVGNFDGVHRGHQVLLHRTKAVAQADNGFCLVVTFEQHTSALLRKAAPPLLMSVEEKLAFFSALGIAGCLLLPFTPELAGLDPEEFLLRLTDLGAKAIIVGHDFTFGKGAVGNTDYLLDFAARHGINAEVIPPVTVDGVIVSSSHIRSLLQAGQVTKARQMLNRPFTVSGPVIHGERRGRTLGFPTANLRLPAERLLPKYGVYFVRCHVRDQEYYGLANVGVKPTFASAQSLIEVYLFDTTEELYGAKMTIEFLEFLRAERRFSSPAELVKQMKRDEEEGRRLLAQYTTG
ncbi:MAG TPA: bifunctional riboflavin kinase/FAD synthetase [Bacillota bacterium]